MAPKRDIVVTGIGVVSPIGIGKDPFWAALCAGRSGIRRLDLFDDPALPSPIGGAVANFDAKQYVRPRKSLKVMSRDIQLAFAAADLAFVMPVPPAADRPRAARRHFPGRHDPRRVGRARWRIAVVCRWQFSLCRWGPAAMTELFPLWMLKYLPNMPACHIGIGQDACCPSNPITMSDVSSLSALAEAGRVSERGQADAIIVGGVGVGLHPVIWGAAT